MHQQSILVTGGAGFIGSHVCVALIDAGYHVVVLDNLGNSHIAVLARIQTITGIRPDFVQGDVRDLLVLQKIFSDFIISGVIHLAGLKAVGESVADPFLYYNNNVVGSITLLSAMQAANIKTFIFSSSATVYAESAVLPIREDFSLSVTSPYGRSKLMVEEILADIYQTKQKWSIACLRYFNAVGAHPSGLIGEDPSGVPNNLMPYIAQVAIGRQQKLNVYGNDYPTPDGTCLRDYIHVMDLALGHVAALLHCLQQHDMLTVNLGTGQGASVLEVIHAFEKASACAIPYELVARRPGDIAQYWANANAALVKLNWQAKYGIAQICEDVWRWQKNNPHGYRS